MLQSFGQENKVDLDLIICTYGESNFSEITWFGTKKVTQVKLHGLVM